MTVYLRILLVVLVVAATIWLLFTTIFPWVESYMEDPRVGVSHATSDEVGGEIP